MNSLFLFCLLLLFPVPGEHRPKPRGTVGYEFTLTYGYVGLHYRLRVVRIIPDYGLVLAPADDPTNHPRAWISYTEFDELHPAQKPHR